MTTESNMKISVINYGPIAEARNIELCPLTVFVGPSNTGKSYLAILIYALFKSFETQDLFYGTFHKKRTRNADRTLSSYTESLDNDLQWIFEKLRNFANFEEDINFSDLPEEFKEWSSKEIAKIINQNFHQEITRCMGISKKETDLIKDKFRLDLEDDQKKLILESLTQIPSMEIKELNLSRMWFGNLDLYPNFLSGRHIPSGRKHLPREVEATVLLDQISEEIFNRHSRRESFYLPAARTGIMQSHRAIAWALLQRATFAGLEAFDVPTLSGIMSDFLGEIILMDTNEIPDSNVGQVAKEMEESILHGSIESENSATNQYPSFLYKQNGIEVPLLRSSSMVSELAPVVLFIKYRVGKGDLLIIEEPEAHLHPEAQRNVAKTVVRLVRAGVRVMVTTHSDYFLEQLGNHVRLSKLAKDQRSEFVDLEDLFLKEDEIGAYSFKPGKDGTSVKRLKFDQENGLSPADHDDVSSNLYNETVEILDKIEDRQ